MDESGWEHLTKNMPRVEMRRRGVSHDLPVERLPAPSLEDDTLDLRNKVARRRIPATSFVRCVVANPIDGPQVPGRTDLLGAACGRGAETLAKKARP